MFLQSFQGKIREVFFQDPALGKRYFKFFLEKIQVKGEKVTIIAWKDILLRAKKQRKVYNSLTLNKKLSFMYIKYWPTMFMMS